MEHISKVDGDPLDKVTYLRKAQDTFEQRFNCIVCMEAKLKMVYGCCQHRLCSDCVYTKKGFLRPKMAKCPICMKPNAFPFHRPEIPEDNIEIQKCLGVRQCPNKSRGCPVEMWIWEMEEHISTCSYKQKGVCKESCKKVSKDNSSSQKTKCSIKKQAKGRKNVRTIQKPYMLRSSNNRTAVEMCRDVQVMLETLTEIP